MNPHKHGWAGLGVEWTPWSYSYDECGDWVVWGAVSEPDARGMTFQPSICTLSSSAGEEEARLMAASPELYEAADAVMPLLAMIEEGFWDDCPFPDVQKRRIAALRAALSKARPSNRGEA